MNKKIFSNDSIHTLKLYNFNCIKYLAFHNTDLNK